MANENQIIIGAGQDTAHRVPKKWSAIASIGLLNTIELDSHLVRIYSNRIAIWRKDGARLGWEELQSVKEKVWGNRVAVEVYPAKCDVVNLRHTRHLWWSEDLERMVKSVCIHAEFGSHVLCEESPAQNTMEICHTAPNSASTKCSRHNIVNCLNCFDRP
jgi:hypothetical protein